MAGIFKGILGFASIKIQSKRNYLQIIHFVNETYNSQYWVDEETGNYVYLYFLFYKTFLLIQKSRNFDDTPVLGGILFIILCIMLNIFAIIEFLDGIEFLKSVD